MPGSTDSKPAPMLAKPGWYVLQTHPKKEAAVVRLLAGAGYEGFCPTMKRGSGCIVPLFPMYCFIRCDLRDAQHHHLIRYTRGVRRILGDQQGPIPVRSDFIDILQASMQHGLIEQQLLYRAGDVVRVKSGMLRDLSGIVEKHTTEDGRVRVLFRWLARKIQATVDYRQLEKAA